MNQLIKKHKNTHITLKSQIIDKLDEKKIPFYDVNLYFDDIDTDILYIEVLCTFDSTFEYKSDVIKKIEETLKVNFDKTPGDTTFIFKHNIYTGRIKL